MNSLISTLLAMLGAGAGLALFYRSKAKSAEALNENLETKESLLANKETQAKNNGNLAVEEAKRKELLNEPSPAADSLEDIVKFFNNERNKSSGNGESGNTPK